MMQSTKRARTQEDKEPAHSLTLGQGMDLIFSNRADPSRSWVLFGPRGCHFGIHTGSM